MDDWQRIAEDAIRQAMDEGKFNQLPGMGKPFHWEDDNPFEDPSAVETNRLLKHHGLSLPWIELGKYINEEIADTTRRLKQAHRTYQLMGIEAAWEAALQQFNSRVETINKLIRDYNLSVPQTSFQRALLQGDHLRRQIEETDASPDRY